MLIITQCCLFAWVLLWSLVDYYDWYYYDYYDYRSEDEDYFIKCTRMLENVVLIGVGEKFPYHPHPHRSPHRHNQLKRPLITWATTIRDEGRWWWWWMMLPIRVCGFAGWLQWIYYNNININSNLFRWMSWVNCTKWFPWWVDVVDVDVFNIGNVCY